MYGLGIYLGSGLARFFGGYAVDFAQAYDGLRVPVIGLDIFSWQIVFFLIAAPTIPLSILLLAIREPARRGVRQIRLPERPSKAAQKPAPSKSEATITVDL